MKSQRLRDNWRAFKAALVERFTDQIEIGKDWQRLREPDYKGDIHTYLAQIEEINSRVGATGEPLREAISNAITPEMVRAIYQRHGKIPNNDVDFIDAVREVGIIEERILLAATHRKKNKEKEKKRARTRARSRARKQARKQAKK